MEEKKTKNFSKYPTLNREYKDSLFRLIFSEKKDLLDLYNALNGTSYSDPEELEVNTLEDAVYISIKNDISFLVGGTLNLYEHQSTYKSQPSDSGVDLSGTFVRRIYRRREKT